ncbi:hypothetical protein ACINIS235_3145 [Acinetobacter baumannii IS-235]|nr:hypothetical protein ACINIS235_3145 [Acinetobacter baumannii IS-235]
MYKLKLNPQTSGYGVTPGDDVKRQQMEAVVALLHRCKT